jgi:hypothetical protein
MTIAIWVLSVLTVAEFVASPINLSTGRDMALINKFTGFSTTIARNVCAPVVIVGAMLIAVGLAVRPLSIVGAALISSVGALYLVRLAAPDRRSATGIFAYLLFGGLTAALPTLKATK